jgi:hypothetical protein
MERRSRSVSCRDGWPAGRCNEVLSVHDSYADFGYISNRSKQ